MKKNYPVEALLRPPIELWSAFCAFGTALIAVLAPWSLMMTPTVGYGTAVNNGVRLDLLILTNDSTQ